MVDGGSVATGLDSFEGLGNELLPFLSWGPLSLRAPNAQRAKSGELRHDKRRRAGASL